MGKAQGLPGPWAFLVSKLSKGTVMFNEGTSPLLAVTILGVLVYLLIRSINSKSLPDEFRRMYAEWRHDGCYKSLTGQMRHDVDYLIDIWLQLKVMGRGVTREEIMESVMAGQEDKF
jgi:hypothetical protein